MKVLVIRRGALGDIIHVAACLGQIKSQRPDVEIHVLTDKNCFPLLEGMKVVSKVHEWPRNSDPIGYLSTLNAARTIKAERVDLIVNLMPSVKSRLIAWYCKVPSFTLRKQRASSRGLALRNSPVPHLAEDYFETVQSALGLSPAKLQDLVPSIQSLASADAHSAKSERIGFVIGVGARRQNKAWPIGHFIELAQRILKDRDCEIVLIGGSREAPLAAQMPNDKRILNRIGLPLIETMQELKDCSVVIGADTGPMHIATALGIPVVMCFGPTFSKRTGPLGEGTVIEPPSLMACWPCELRSCPLRGDEFQKCMKDISVDEVFQSCRSILEPVKKHLSA